MTNTTSIVDDPLYPNTLEEFLGQADMKDRLLVSIQAAINDDRPFGHTLLIGPSGAGKSALASLIAAELGYDFAVMQMPVKASDFCDFVEDWDGGALFLDELHSAPKAFQEMLQPGLVDGQATVRAPNSDFEVDVSHITFIGATTNEMREKIIGPLRMRFEHQPVWAPYSDEEMAGIALSMAVRLGVPLDAAAAAALGRAACGVPRVVSQLVRKARDLHAVGRDINGTAILSFAEIDEDGLNHMHRLYLQTLHSMGKRAGLNNLARMMSMSPASVEALEPVLVRRQLVRYEQNGRKLTPAGAEKVNPDRTKSRRRRVATGSKDAQP